MATDNTPNVRRLARQLVDVTRRLKHLETVPQLAHSSLDNQGMHVYDADGNLSVTLGKQEDGTYSARPVAGPTPPAPVGLDAEGDAGLIHASWQGVFWAGAAMPRDFEAVEVLVDGNVQGAIHDPDGGSVTVPAFAGEREVSFRTLSQAGRRSDATGHVTVTVQSKASVQLDEARGRIEDAEGDLAGAQARIDTALDAEGHVREDEILRNATLLGETVVQEINVTGKLIGTDGVFTGTVDFENVNVTGLQLVEKLEAHSISADLIEGGAFTGESFTGGTFIGGEFRTSDTLPGQVTLADNVYVSSFDGVARPGISVEPEDAARFAILPGIGPEPVGMTIDGGKLTTGESSHIKMYPDATAIRTRRADGTTGGAIQTSPTESLMRTYRENGAIGGGVQTSPDSAFIFTNREDGTTAGEIATLPASSFMQTYREDGTVGGAIQTTPTLSTMRTYSGNSSEKGWVQVQPQDAELAYVDANNTYFSRIKADASEAFLYTRAGGANRYLTVDADGIWVKTNKGGSWKQYNLEETAQDSGWHPIQVLSGYAAQPNYEPKARKVGNLIYLSGGINGSGIGANTSQYVMRLPESFRPANQSIYVVGGSSSGAACPLLAIQPDGRVSLRTTATTGSYYLMDGISFIPE